MVEVFVYVAVVLVPVNQHTSIASVHMLALISCMNSTLHCRISPVTNQQMDSKACNGKHRQHLPYISASIALQPTILSTPHPWPCTHLLSSSCSLFAISASFLRVTSSRPPRASPFSSLPSMALSFTLNASLASWMRSDSSALRASFS